eukprot:10915932-Ditylum_brightwellii.AAC.1
MIDSESSSEEESDNSNDDDSMDKNELANILDKSNPHTAPHHTTDAEDNIESAEIDSSRVNKEEENEPL